MRLNCFSVFRIYVIVMCVLVVEEPIIGTFSTGENCRDMGIKSRWEYHYHKGNQALPCPPHSLNIEPTNICNLNCPGCSLDKGRDHGMMDIALFDQIAKQAADIGIEEVRLFLAGEPFLHKEIIGMISGCTDLGLRSIIHTNGMKLDKDKARGIIDAGLSVISFSIDGADKEEYEKARVGAKFDTVIQNVKALLELKRKGNAELPYVIIQSIIPVGGKLEPPPGLVSIFKRLPVGHFKPLHPHNWRGECDMEKIRAESPRPNPCMFLWHELSVGWDGRVMGCCADLNGFLIRGDLSKETIMDVWNNDEARLLRNVHTQRRPDQHPLCDNCSVPFQNQKVTPLKDVYKQTIKGGIKSLMGRK